MSETENKNNIVAFETGKPLTDVEISHAESIALVSGEPQSTVEPKDTEVANHDPDRNTAQELLRMAGGSQRAGETLADVRKRGVKRVVVAGAAALSLAGTADVATDAFAGYQERQDARNVQLMEDYKENNDFLDKGKVVISFDEQGLAWNAGQKLTSGKDTGKLIDQIQNQTDAQGYPGIEPGEIAVVDANLVNPDSPQIIDRGPNE